MSAPSHVQSLLEAGLVALDGGDYDTALEKWNAVLEFDPSHPRAARLVRDLQSLMERARGGHRRHPAHSVDVSIVVDEAASGALDGAAARHPEPPPESQMQTGLSTTLSDTDRSTLMRLQEMLGEQRAQFSAASEQLAEARAEVARLRAELAQRERTLLEERETQIRMDQQVNVLQTQLDEARTRALSAQSEAAEVRLSFNGLRAELDVRAAEVARQLEDVTTKHEQLVMAHEALQHRARSLEVDAVSSENARIAVAEHLSSLEENYERVLQRAIGAEAELENLQSERDEAVRVSQDNEETIRGLREQQTALQSEVLALQQTLQEVRALREESSAPRARLDTPPEHTETMKRMSEQLLPTDESGEFSEVESTSAPDYAATLAEDAAPSTSAVASTPPHDEELPFELSIEQDVDLQETAVYDAVARPSPQPAPHAEPTPPSAPALTPINGPDALIMDMELLNETSPRGHSLSDRLDNESDLDELINNLTMLESPPPVADAVEEVSLKEPEPRTVEQIIGERVRSDQPEPTMLGLRLGPDEPNLERPQQEPPAPLPPPAPSGRATRGLMIMDHGNRAPYLSADALEKRSTLGAREAFVIQYVDGHITFEDLFDICGLPPSETRNILQNLYDRGIIDFDTD